jgi:hypothetical protein
MTPIRGFPGMWAAGSRPFVKRYPLGAGAAFFAGDFVYLTSGEVAEVSGADPTPILGLAAEHATGVVETGYVTVNIATDDMFFRLKGDTPYVEATHLGNDYAIIETSAVYLVDTADATTNNHRVHVVGGDASTDNDFFLCKFIAAHRQLG